ncbi:MAG: ankyrin repeat domain-containing protein [Candidatus Babeliales bacterium]
MRMPKPLFQALYKNNIEKVKELIATGADCNAKEDGQTALTLAILRNSQELVNLLLQAGADVNLARKEDFYTPLMVAVIMKNSDLVATLLAHKAQVDVHSPVDGMTPLRLAIKRGFKDIAELLLHASNDLDNQQKYTALCLEAHRHNRHAMVDLLSAKTNIDPTLKEKLKEKPTQALFQAIKENNKEKVQEALLQGADIEHRNEKGNTPLLEAYHHYQDTIIKLLLQHGADTQEIKESIAVYYTNIFESFCCYRAFNPVENIIKGLTSYGIDAINEPGCDNATVLMEASNAGETKLVKLLIEHGAQVNLVDKYGNTALMRAADTGHLEIVQYLLEHGAEIDHVDEYGNSALRKAARNGHTQVVKLLLDHGADINQRNSYGGTLLMAASYSGHADIVKILLERGADIHLTDNAHETALDKAAQRKKVEVIKVLVEHGAPITSSLSLDVATFFKNIKRGNLVEIELALFLNKDAHINATNNQGNTALHMTLEAEGHAVVIKLFLDHGADINLCNNEGYSVIMLAVQKRRKDVVTLLLQAGADLSLQSKEGKTALDYAQHEEIKAMILQAQKKLG